MRRETRATLAEDARWIFDAALRDCAPDRLIANCLRRGGGVLEGPGFHIPIRRGSRLTILAYGKAAVGMARALRRRIPHPDLRGLIVAPAGPRPRISGFTLCAGTHPLPGIGSFRAGRQLLRRMTSARDGEWILHLISGGASALAAAPLTPLIDPPGKTLLHRLLVHSGLGIEEINVIRKHFSAIKGGRLLLAAPRSPQASLILSDVPAGLPEVVGGGPTLPDPSTWKQCREILRRGGIDRRLPERVRASLSGGRWPETPKPDHPAFAAHGWTVVGSSEDLLRSGAAAARVRGYRVQVVSSGVEESPEQLLRRFDGFWPGAPGSAPLCLLAVGEVRVSPPADAGRGGRAQDLAAAAASFLRRRGRGLLLAAGSDGRDGNSRAAGAIADATTWERARRAGLDPDRFRREGNTYELFRRLGDLVVTGPTGNNLRDLYLLLDRPERKDRSGLPRERRAPLDGSPARGGGARRRGSKAKGGR